jgi:serine/threonine protein kinase
LYALGCVAYWLLTGHLVFKKETQMMLLLAHIQDPPAPLAQRAPEPVPHALELCIMDCLAKSAEQRPQTARALLARLADAERELSPDEIWTDERAQAWWQKHQPLARTSTPDVTPSPIAQIRIADAPR